MKLPVEDGIGDVLSKAQKGLGISTEALAGQCGISEGAVRAIRKGEPDLETAGAMAKAMDLNVPAVLRIAKGDWRPADVGEIAGFAMVCSPFYDWQVNAFVFWDDATKRAVALDTGTEGGPMIELLEGRGLELEAILLTHAHRDHVEGLPSLTRRWPDAKVFLPAKEDAISVETERFAEGFRYQLGALSFEAFTTPGHTEGGTSFLVSGLERGIAVVGDALFSGSMGGANISYAAGLASVQRILGLSEDTVLAPGHGPLTTVKEEREMNCFAASSLPWKTGEI